MELREALVQIDEIRQRMAHGETFRGYRSMTCAASGGLALLVAAVQPYIVPTHRLHPHLLQRHDLGSVQEALGRYLMLWIAAAALSLMMVAIELWRRVHRDESALTRQATRVAAAQFIPSLAVGAIVTLIIYRQAPHVAWLLPGLWSLLFALGIFASHQLLPRLGVIVGVYYAVCGVVCLTGGQGDHALSPWQMAISFGGGQFLSAAILYLTLERRGAS